MLLYFGFFFFQAEDGIRDVAVTGVQTCALPIWAQVAYFAARGGAENVRVLLMPGGPLEAAATNLGMPDKNNNAGVMYVKNPAAGETEANIDPTTAGNASATVTSNPYLDDELCLEQF